MKGATRATVALLLAAIIWLGPGFSHVLGARQGWMLRWGMFSGKAAGILAVHIEVEQAGQRRVVTWDEFEEPPPPHSVRRAAVVKDVNAVIRHGRRICAQLGGDVEVYLTARLTSRKGWEQVLDGSDDVCARSLHRPKRGKRDR